MSATCPNTTESPCNHNMVVREEEAEARSVSCDVKMASLRLALAKQMQQMSSALTPSLTNQVDPPTMPVSQGAFVPSAAPVTVQGSFLPSEGGSSGAVPMGAPVAGSSGVSDLGAQLQQLLQVSVLIWFSKKLNECLKSAYFP